MNKTVVWVNQDIPFMDALIHTINTFDGEGNKLHVFTDDKGREQRLYVPADMAYAYIKANVEPFINELIIEPLDLTDFVVGDYWPSDGDDTSYMGNSYEELVFEDTDWLGTGETKYDGVQIYMLVEDASEYEL
jgi:hypothetical protein